MLFILACDVAVAQRVGVQLEVAAIGRNQCAVELSVVLGADVDLVFGRDAGLFLDPVLGAIGLAVPDRAADAAAKADHDSCAEVEFLAFDFPGVRQGCDVQVATYASDDIVAAQRGTGNVGVLPAGETELITGVQVRFLLLFAFALQVAFADVDAGVNTDASRTDGDTSFPAGIFTGVFGGAVVLGCLDVEGVAGIQIDVSLCLDLSADQVKVIAGLEVDVTTCLQRSNGRGLLTLITLGDAAAAAHADFEPATAAAVDTTPAFLLAGFLAVAAFGGIKRDIPAFDVYVAASLQLATADLNIIARRNVQVVACVQRRGAVGRFDHLLAGALLAVTELSIARRARQELRGAVYCLERARSLARGVLTLACAADGVLGAAIVVINARTQAIA
ncbi:hypothetical protein ALQ09_200065 [Pseudomonas viridiflava]|nr:hypothetical protein ALQ09_200065 [Pseudomonas viridiflava]